MKSSLFQATSEPSLTERRQSFHSLIIPKGWMRKKVYLLLPYYNAVMRLKYYAQLMVMAKKVCSWIARPGAFKMRCRYMLFNSTSMTFAIIESCKQSCSVYLQKVGFHGGDCVLETGRKTKRSGEL